MICITHRVRHAMLVYNLENLTASWKRLPSPKYKNRIHIFMVQYIITVVYIVTVSSNAVVNIQYVYNAI